MDWAGLLDQVNKHFDLEGLRTLCFALGEDYDNLGGEGKRAKARELILSQYRRERMPELIAALTRQRPYVPWGEPTASHQIGGATQDVPAAIVAHNTGRSRPAQGGDSLSHHRAGAATLGCLVVDRVKPNQVYILGDLSALCPAGVLPRVGEPIIQPGRADGGALSQDQIAALARWGTLQDDPLAAADNVAAAIAQVRNLQDVSPEIRGRGFLKGVRPAAPGMTVFAVGRTSGLVSGEIAQIDAAIELGWPINQVSNPHHTGDGAAFISILFGGLIVCSLKMAPGDGGMILVDEDNYAVGLGFASGNDQAFFIPMQKALDALQVNLVTEAVWQSLLARDQAPDRTDENAAAVTANNGGAALTREEPHKTAVSADITPYQKDIQEIARQLQRGRLVLFVGADFPQSAAGLPSRQALADLLANQEGIAAGGSLAAVAQQVMGAGNRWRFTNFLREATDSAGKTAQPLHQAIVKLVQTHKIETVITTAYDEMLELAFQQSGAGLNVIVRADDLGYIHKDRPTLIRLYGHARQPDSLVVTEQDQNGLLRGRDKRELVDEIQYAFRRSSVLYLGHDLGDPITAALMDEWVAEQSPRSYAVWSGLTARETEFFNSKRNLHVLAVEPLALLQALLSDADV
jgi:hypothetical protein